MRVNERPRAVASLFAACLIVGCAGGDGPRTETGEASHGDDPGDDLVELGERYAAAWSSGDPDRLASFYAPRGTLTVNEGDAAVGRDAVRSKAAGFMEAFPDMRVTMDSIVVLTEGADRHAAEASGNVRRAVFHWHWTGTNTGAGGTGKSVDLRGYEVWTLGPGDAILASDGHFDAEEYARQLDGE